LNGKFSEREIEEHPRFNFAYIYLSSNATLSHKTINSFKNSLLLNLLLFFSLCHKTINSFKNENKELMWKIFVRTRKMGRELGIVKLKNLAIDGTTVKANASKNSRYDKMDLLIAKELVEKGISIDEEENILHDKKSEYRFTSEQLKQLKRELEKKQKTKDSKSKKETKKEK
jgi:transposase